MSFIQSLEVPLYMRCMYMPMGSYLWLIDVSFPSRVDNLQQGKARLEVANQTLKAQHQKELEGREEELEQIKATTNKKLKVLGDQVEELHEEKQQAVKVGPAMSC